MSDGFSILERMVRSASVRQGVISSNIANVDTPGYKAKDVKFESILESEVGLKVTNPRHLGGSESGVAPIITEADAQSWPDKNTVELDQEVAKMTENAMLYHSGVSMLETKIRMFKSALRR
jgi:flagellar basal-body rod protein FlgB